MAETILKAKDLRNQSATELQGQLEKLRQELWQGRMKVREGALQQHHVLSRARRQVARIQTVLREQQATRGERSAEKNHGKR